MNMWMATKPPLRFPFCASNSSKNFKLNILFLLRVTEKETRVIFIPYPKWPNPYHISTKIRGVSDVGLG